MLTLSGVTTNFGSDLEYQSQILTKQVKICFNSRTHLRTRQSVSSVSSRNTVLFIDSVLSSVVINMEDTFPSYRTIQRFRMLLRKHSAQGLRNDFKTHDNTSCIGMEKHLSDVDESISVDRLPILLTAFGIE